MKLGKADIKKLHEDKFLLESFKTLRTNLLYTKDLQVIAITSSTPNEGKTTSAFYLAKSYIEIGKKVVLIDCDLRKGSLRKFFTTKVKTKGLSDFLSQQSHEFIYETNEENLFVIFAGKIPPNPTELLTSSQFDVLIQTLKKEFDVIIIDTSPMSAGIDASIVGRAADGIVMVIRNNFVKKQTSKRVKRELERNGGRVVGVVLNRIEKHQVDYYEYGYGEYYT